jgi:hypothetical protein
MKVALFNTQINTAWDLLRHLGIGGERNWHPHYGNLQAATFRHLTYVEVWKTCVNESFYDFQLSDNSLLQFRVPSFEPLETSYAYYECPLQCQTYSDFLSELGFAYEDVHDELRTEYEDYVSTCELKDTVTPIRYDFSPDLYRAGLHPASHVHFGHNSPIRVATHKILYPLSFVLFVLRQCYPAVWQTFWGYADADTLCRNVRESLADIPTEFWDPWDNCEMRLE